MHEYYLLQSKREEAINARILIGATPDLQVHNVKETQKFESNSAEIEVHMGPSHHTSTRIR
jgi:hypothetical protein